jgi:hypothetical protein
MADRHRRRLDHVDLNSRAMSTFARVARATSRSPRSGGCAARSRRSLRSRRALRSTSAAACSRAAQLIDEAIAVGAGDVDAELGHVCVSTSSAMNARASSIVTPRR